MLNTPIFAKQKFKISKVFKRKTLAKNPFFSPYFFIIQVKENICINRNQILSLNHFLSKLTRKRCNILFKNISFIPFTKKPVGIRMGKGKGGSAGWCSVLKKGSVLVQIETVQKNIFNKNFQKKLLCIMPCSIYQINCKI
jgi:ribosomal protein L16/L10AE